MMELSGTAPVQRRRLPLLALLIANAVSSVGTMLTVVALPWFVLETTGSAARAGLTGFFVVLPGFLAGIFGGVVVDRLGFKRVSVLADLISGVAIALVPLLYRTGALAFWQLLILVFVGNLLEIPAVTARRSLLPELATLADTRLERVNAAYEGNQQLALLVGAPLAGVLVAWRGAANVLWLDAATFVFSALVIAVIVPALGARATGPSGRYLGEVAAGIRFLRADPTLLALAVTLGLSNLFGNPIFAVVMPVYARAVFGSASTLGLVLGVFGAGQLVGTLAYGGIGHRLPRPVAWLIPFLTFPAIYWILLVQPPLMVLVVVFAVVGLLEGPLNPLAVTIRHERIPLELRGRVFATFSAIAVVAAPVGIVSAGVLIETLGFRSTVLGFAAGAQLLGIGMLFVPALRHLDPAPARSHDITASLGTD